MLKVHGAQRPVGHVQLHVLLAPQKELLTHIPCSFHFVQHEAPSPGDAPGSSGVGCLLSPQTSLPLSVMFCSACFVRPNHPRACIHGCVPRLPRAHGYIMSPRGQHSKSPWCRAQGLTLEYGTTQKASTTTQGSRTVMPAKASSLHPRAHTAVCSRHLGSQVQFLPPPVTGWVTLGMSVCLLKPQFAHL